MKGLLYAQGKISGFRTLPFVMFGFAFASYVLLIFAIVLLRYLLVAGFAWWLFCSRSFNLDSDSLHDLRLSVVSAGIFAFVMAVAVKLHLAGYGQIYFELRSRGLGYAIGSYLLVIVIQDGFFYAAHRLLHHPRLYRWAHLGHHRSRRPSPWTSFAFDPFESLIHSLFLLLPLLAIPLYLGTALAVLATMTVWAVVNHLGLKKLPVSIAGNWLGQWVIGPAHHSVHHERQNLHFGLYFTFWDRLFGTEDPSFGCMIARR